MNCAINAVPLFNFKFLISLVLTKTEGIWREKLSKLNGTFSKVAFTCNLILLPAILLVWEYNSHFLQVKSLKQINLLSNLDESNDTTRRDLKYHRTETGEKVIWLRPELDFSSTKKFKIPPEKQSDGTKLQISDNVLCDSIPKDWWLIAESYIGEIRMTRNSVKLITTNTIPNYWQPLELLIDLKSPWWCAKRCFNFIFMLRQMAMFMSIGYKLNLNKPEFFMKIIFIKLFQQPKRFSRYSSFNTFKKW